MRALTAGSLAMVPLVPHRCCVRLVADHASRVSDGLFYNDQLGAHNIWEIDVDEALIDEAAAIFFDGAPFASLQQPGEPYEDIPTSIGNFFAHRVSWKSDIAWSSTDDDDSFAALQSVFNRLELAERFAHVVPHRSTLRLYNAFFVSRSRCDERDFHTDYFPEVGTHALTLIAPLRDYAETGSFQLSYVPASAVYVATMAPDSVFRFGSTWFAC